MTTRQLYGILCGVLSAGLFAVLFVSATPTGYARLPMAISGGLQFGFCYNLILGRDVTHTDWADDERYQWCIAAGVLLLATVVIVASLASIVMQ